MECSLASLNELLQKYNLPSASSLLGRKFCFTAKSNSVFPDRIIVDSIASVQFEGDDETLQLIPQSKSDPVFGICAVVFQEYFEETATENCELLIWAANDGVDAAHFEYQAGKFELLDP